MRDAVLVSTARTPIGKAFRGAFSDTAGQHLAAHAITAALTKAGVEGAEVEDVILGCAMPEGSTGMTIDRQCVESISLVRNEHKNRYREADDWLSQKLPSIYLPMLETAEIVAERYGIGREQQDEFAPVSQQCTAVAQQRGVFDEEIVPFPGTRVVADSDTGGNVHVEFTLDRDEGNRPSTTAEGVAGLRTVLADGAVAAGSASIPTSSM